MCAFMTKKTSIMREMNKYWGDIMLKKINMVIITFFLILTVKGDFLFTLYLPVLLFYIFKDKKNILYIYPASIISIAIFAREYLLITLIILLVATLFLYLFKLGVKKDLKFFSKTKLSISLFIVIVNTVTIFLYPKTNQAVWFLILLEILSVAIYFFLDFYLFKLLNDFKDIKIRFFVNDNKTYHSYIFLEIMLALLASIGASFVEIFSVNLFVVVGSYFAMYLSRKFKNIYSLLFGVIASIFGFFYKNLNESLFILLISGVYSIRSIYTIGILNAFLAMLILGRIVDNPSPYIAIMAVSIVFEIVSYFLMNIKSDETNEFEELHAIAQKSVNEEILKFAGFLDRFVVGFQNPKGYNEKLSSGIKTIIDQHCKNCPKQKDCFHNNKKELYPVFKEVLVGGDIENDYPEYFKICEKYPSIQNTSKILNQHYDYSNNNEEVESNNYILLAQINSVSTALKNYVLDTTSKTEINYQLLQKAKEYLEELEYEITYYEVKRSYEHDFLIKIGFKGKTINQIRPILETLFESITNEKISVELIKEENTTTYIHVLPEMVIDVVYAYGNMPTEDEIISGDNYSVKELDNGHILFAISDGMGKGYSAFYESDMTLKFVEDIVQLNIEPSTALTILNTFYVVQDYLERYATLDFLDINRHNAMATFYKMGANTTYIFRKDGSVDKIINKSLPLGIDEEVDQKTYKLEDEDLIIMSSDGVLENLIDNQKLESFIQESRDLSPQQLVYEILNYTIKNQIKTKDDMTIIALKIKSKHMDV